jgi:hypothetical protein
MYLMLRLMREFDTVTVGVSLEDSAFVGSDIPVNPIPLLSSVVCGDFEVDEETAKAVGVVNVGKVVESMTGSWAVVNGVRDMETFAESRAVLNGSRVVAIPTGPCAVAEGSRVVVAAT